MQALGVLAALEDHPVIGPLTLEHGAGIVQPMRQNVDLALAPRDELAIHPDPAVAVVIGHK
jgi:hypothetical protein